MLTILHNTAHLSLELGSPVFGYASTLNPLHTSALKPFQLRGRIDESVIGITDKTLRWDENLSVSTDVDITFESIKRSRLAFVDNRYGWEHDRWTAGGLSSQRTVEVTNANLKYLQDKWGRKFIRPFKDKTKSKSGLSVSVKLNV